MNENFKNVTKEDYEFMKWARPNYQFTSEQQQRIVDIYRKLINPNTSRCSGCKAYSQILDFKRELDVYMNLNKELIEEHLSLNENNPIEEKPIKKITNKKINKSK